MAEVDNVNMEMENVEVENSGAAEVAGGNKKVSLKKKVSVDHYGGPKKSPSGYMLFCDSVRSTVMEELKAGGATLKLQDIAKKCAERWKTVKDSEEGKALNEKAVELKTAYDEEVLKWQQTAKYQEYLKADTAHEKKKAKATATKAAKESGMPKKPMAAYMLYSMEETPGVIEAEKAKNGGKAPNMTQRASIIKATWDTLGAEGQKPYSEKWQAAREQYAVDIEAWNKSEEGLKYKQALLDTNPKKALKEAGEPTRPRSAFLLFQNSHLSELAEQNGGKRLPLKEGSAAAKAKWESLTPEDQKVWTEKYDALVKKYEEDMKAFKKTDAYKKYNKVIEKAKKRASVGKEKAGGKKRKTENGEEPQPEESPDEAVEEDSAEEEAGEEEAGEEEAGEEEVGEEDAEE